MTIVYKKVLRKDNKFTSAFSADKCCLTYELNKITKAPLTKLGNKQLLFAYRSLEAVLNRWDEVDYDFGYLIAECEAEVSMEQPEYIEGFLSSKDREIYWNNIKEISELTKEFKESFYHTLWYSIDKKILFNYIKNTITLIKTPKDTVLCNYIKPVRIIKTTQKFSKGSKHDHCL